MADTATKSPLMTRELAVFLVFVALAYLSLNLLFAALPLYVDRHGGDSGAAGLVNGVMLLCTVLAEPFVPRALAAVGYRILMAIGAALMGIPAIALVGTHALAPVLAVSAARGVGLGIVVVAATSLAAELGGPGRRGEAIGLYGLAALLPAMVGLPGGVWLAEHAGFGTLFLVTTAAATIASAAAFTLSAHRSAPAAGGHVLAVLRVRRVALQALIFTASTIGAGVLITFVPIITTGTAHPVAAAALLVDTATTALARLVAGRRSDRRGVGRMIQLSLLLVAGGAALVAFTGSPAAVLAGMAIFGVGFGALQNLTLISMFASVSQSQFGQVSAVWNMAFDAGMGLGATAFGYLAIATGYRIALLVIAGLLALALIPEALAERDEPSTPV